MDPAQRIEAADEFLAEMAETRGGEDVSVWKRIVAAVRGFFRRMGFHATWTDDEIADLFRQSRKTLKRNRAAKGEAARLAIFGEEGVRRMENAVQLLENLATAKQMTAEGKDAKVIKLATGWELGGDGKWRMEMPDAVFTTRAKLPDGAEYDRTLWDVVNTTNGKLSEYVVADEIFEAYPELKDYHFQIGQMPSGVGGSFNPDTKTIYINQLGLTAALKMVDDAQARLSDETLTAAERKSAQHSVDLWTEQIFSQINETLVHEVQHAIQHIEGFATGSNVRHFIDNPEYDPKRLEKVSYYSEKFESARQNLEEYPELKKMVDRYVELEDVLFSDDNVQVDEAAIDAEMDQIKAHFESIGKRELFMDYITGRDNYTMAKDAAEKHKLDPVESYRRTAGEVEARNVQERMDMTMEERLNSLLSETQDVAEKDKIYLNGLVRGGSEMAADEDGKYFPAPDEWGTAYTSMTGKGLQAILLLLEKKDGFVPAAFNRPEIGDIDIVYGKTGFGIDDKGGYGLAHIEKRRGKGHVDWEIFANTITNGTYVPKSKSKVYFIDEKSKVIVKLSFKKIKRKWVVSAMGNDLTFAADRLLASNPREAAKQGIAPKGLYTIGDIFDKIKLNSSEKSEKTSEKINGGTDEYGDDNSRLSVAPDDAFVQAWAKVLLPVVSTQYINVDGAAAYLMDHGIEVYAGRDDDTLRKACVLAQTWKKERNKVVRGNREHKELEKKDPYYKILSGMFGRDFQINAGPKYDGTVFTGTWMDKHKTEKGRSGGISAAEAAKILTESTGKEVTEGVVVWWNRQGGR